MANAERSWWARRHPPARPAIALEPVMSGIAADVPRRHGADVEPDLIRARLADRYRDAQLIPLSPEDFDGLALGLDAEAWRRLALAVAALDGDAIRPALPALLRPPVEGQVRTAFVDFARSTGLMTLDLLRQSPHRVEEFTRLWLDRLGAAVVGETEKQSRERLARLDYARLLAEAERARQEAEGRMDYLRERQEQAARRARRGK
jgi:hypothetical protein